MADLVLQDEQATSSGSVFASCDAALFKYAQNFNMQSLALPLHKTTVVTLQQRCQALVEEKERRREELAKSGAEIARLWTLLRIPQVERESFQNSFKMNLSLETLARGKQELERLQFVRTESVGRVVQSIRADIAALWDEAGVESISQRQSEFPDFYTSLEALQDSAVDVHETYYSTIRARVEELRPMLSEISRREVVVQERVELEHLQMNPERLSARGPHAREERKREEGMNARVKNLEKITKKVMAMIAAWEEHNGPFLYSGERYADRVEEQEQNFQEIRASLRNSRKRKDEKAPAGKVPVKRPASGSAASTKVSSSGYGQGSSRPGNKENETGRNAMSSSFSLPKEGDAERGSGGETSGLSKLALSDRQSLGSDASGETEVREPSRASTATVVRSH